MVSAARAFDRDLVRGIIEEEGLDPVPSTNEPRIVIREGVSLTVEEYGWGRVFYAEWKSRNVGCTWVERADEDSPDLPPWVVRVRAFVDRPGCLGHHEPDHVCDGGKNPETGEREPACRWRDVCRYVQTVAVSPENVPKALEANDDDLFARAAMMFPARRTTPKEKPAIVVVDPRKDAKELVEAIARRVCELGGWEFNPARWRATVGQFFLVEHDRIASDRGPVMVLFRRRPQSLTGELRRDSTTEQSIARFFPHVNRPDCTVQIRTGEIELVRERVRDGSPHLAVSMARAEVTYTSGGGERPLATVRNVAREDVDVVATAIRDVIVGGFLDSWGARVTDPDRKGHPRILKAKRW